MSTKRYVSFIYVTALLSVASLVIICVSMGTQGWILATASVAGNFEEGPVDDSNVVHGLFTGSLIRRIVQTPRTYDLYITCDWPSNACAWSCLTEAAARLEEVKALLAGEKPPFSCPLSISSVDKPLNLHKNYNETYSGYFVNAGAWISTIVTLVLLIIAATLSIVLSILNSLKSPAEPLFNVQGLYLINGVAIGFNMVVLIIFGCHYALITQYNVAIRDTLVGEYKSRSNPGYSYWLLLSPMCLHVINIGMLFLRETLVNSDPAETKVDYENATDGTIVLF